MFSFSLSSPPPPLSFAKIFIPLLSLFFFVLVSFFPCPHRHPFHPCRHCHKNHFLFHTLVTLICTTHVLSTFLYVSSHNLNPLNLHTPLPPLLTFPLLPLVVLADGNFCGRWDQADASRPPAVLRQAEGQREEQEALWPLGCVGVQPGIWRVHQDTHKSQDPKHCLIHSNREWLKRDQG